MFLVFVETAFVCLSCCVALGAGIALRVGNAQSNLAQQKWDVSVAISCSTLSVTNNGAFEVEWFQLLSFPSQSCEYDFGHKLLDGHTTSWLNLANNLPSPVSDGPLQKGDSWVVLHGQLRRIRLVKHT